MTAVWEVGWKRGTKFYKYQKGTVWGSHQAQQRWQGFSDAQKNLNCHETNMLPFGCSYDDSSSASAKGCSRRSQGVLWAGCQQLSCLWLDIHSSSTSLSCRDSHLPDFWRAACWVWPRAVCSSDFSETRIPIVWIWTFRKGKSSQRKTSLLATATSLLSQKDNSVKSSCS